MGYGQDKYPARNLYVPMLVRKSCTPCHDCKRRKVQFPAYSSVIVASLDTCRKPHMEAVCRLLVVKQLAYQSRGGLVD